MYPSTFIINSRIRIVKTLLTDHRLPPPWPAAEECLSFFIKPLWGQRFKSNKAIRPYGFINKGTQRDMLYYCFNIKTSSKENSPAIGSFLWVVMLSMIMKPQLRSMWEQNIEDLVRGKFPNSMVLMNQKFHFRRCRPMWSFKVASFRPVWGTNSDDPVVTIIEVLPLPPSRTIGNIGVSTGARQPSLAKT